LDSALTVHHLLLCILPLHSEFLNPRLLTRSCVPEKVNPANQRGNGIDETMVGMPCLSLASPEDALQIIDSLAELGEELPVIEIHLSRMLLKNHCEFFC
jgi:hypothetical protein